MSALTSVMLLEQWRDRGDERAVAEFLRRYFDRLARLISKRLSRRLQRRVDPEDVAQSACRTFFVRIRDGRIEIDADQEPWQLLAKIAMRKLFRAFEVHQAGKRSIAQEQSAPGGDDGVRAPSEGIDPVPSPEEVLGVEEELEWVLQKFQPLHRAMNELHLQGYSIKEIAAQTSRTERTVGEVIRCFKEALRQRWRQLTG